MSQPIRVISSMATAGLLKEICPLATPVIGQTVGAESIGGVDATRRIQSAENFDVVVLANRAIDQLIDQGHIHAGSRVDLALSRVAIAVGETASAPDLSSEEKLKEVMLQASTVGYSTGPSGVAIEQLIERWGLSEQLKQKMVQAKPGQAVGSLIAQGKVQIGFQQMSELMHLPGIQIVGKMPPGTEIKTVFSAGLCRSSEQVANAQRVIDFFASNETAQAKRNQGMDPL